MNETWYRSLVEESHDALAVLDLDGVQLYASPATEGLLGKRPADGRPFAQYLHPDDRDEATKRWDALEQDGPGRLGRCRLLRADGVYLWVEEASRRGRGPDGQPIVTLSIRTGDARRSLRATIDYDQRLAGELERLLAPHRTLLTAVAHQLRTPMTMVLAAAETLSARSDTLPKDQLASLREQLLRNARRLRDRVDQFLSADSARSMAAPVRADVSMRPLVDSVVHELYSEDANIAVEVDAAAVLAVNEADVVAVLRALLSNAIVHTGLGTSVRVLLEDTPQGAVLVVQDNGHGVPASRSTQVFEPFVTFDVPPYRPTVGLGLHLVARIALAHGGHAWIEESPGGGTRVCVRLTDVRLSDVSTTA